jgi:uncharacterized protein (DUF433 family)
MSGGGFAMDHPLIHDRGRGPELVGTRITVYALVPFFLRADTTEAEIAESFLITVEQVAAMRAYFLHHSAEVIAEYQRQEEWFQRGVEEQAKRFPPTPYDLRHFHAWVREREELAANGGEPFPANFKERLELFRELKREWIAEHWGQPLEVACRD